MIDLFLANKTPLYFAAVEEEAGGISALGLDPFALLAQTITFLVLFWVIKKFALEKIVNTLEERRKKIDDSVRLGEELEAERGVLQMKVEKALKEARSRADEIVAEAHHEAGEIAKQSEEEAAARVSRLLDEAHQRIEDDMARARTQLEKDMLRLVADATSIILEEKIGPEKDEQLIKKALAEVVK